MRNHFKDWLSGFFFIRLSVLDVSRTFHWARRRFRSPAPHFVKMRILGIARGADVWIETGTYLGQTSRVLSKLGGEVKTIEPSEGLVQDARLRLKKILNLEIIHGLSEEKLEGIVSNIKESRQKSVAFWLDGHYSAGSTFLGPLETPIERELEIISSSLDRFREVWIFVDDFRCFVGKETDYPGPQVLVQWAAANNLTWTVEQDIFIASNSKASW